MFTTPKPVVKTCRQTDNQPSIERRTAIQIELQELRNLLLEGKTLETHHTDLSEDHGLIAFKSELEEDIKPAEMR
jgi:hypothetical protein